jgi:hypothetical protein
MTGMTDYSSRAFMNYITGQVAETAVPSVWMALMTTPSTDANTGGTEVSGGAYARVQVAGQLAAASAATTIITFGAVPSWVVAGMSVNDVTTPANVPANTVVNSVTGTTVTCNNTVSGVGTDTIRFSAFTPSTGSAPSTITNGSAITFPQATLSWGTVVAFELRDAVTTGNLLLWDWLGAFAWRPFTATLASPSVLTVPAHGYSAADPVVINAEYGGAFPTGTGSWLPTTVYAVTSPATDTFNIATNATTASGSGMVRKIVQQSIPSGVTASFAAAALVASGA